MRLRLVTLAISAAILRRIFSRYGRDLKMHPIPQNMFDIYGLALPWGLSFVDSLPIAGWRTADAASWGIVTFNEQENTFGCIAMRQRVDFVWTLTLEAIGLASFDLAKQQLATQLIDGNPREPVPRNSGKRPNLYKAGKRKPSNLFEQLKTKRRAMAAWMIGYLYYALPQPDLNWVPDFQGENLHTRLWELHLFACFREQGMHVAQDHPSPDYYVSNRKGASAWIEAVTTNPEVRYDHATAIADPPPGDVIEKILGSAAVRYAKTIRNKLDRRYHEMSHVVGKPFALALADFYAQGSMTWSRPALVAYLFGFYAVTHEVDGQQEAKRVNVERLLGPESIPAGLFKFPENSGLSAVIFSNGCSIQKFGRVMVSITGNGNGYRHTRVGSIFDRMPGALQGFDFCLDVSSEEYRDLWPQGYEPWSAELEVFHNPLASHPFPKGLLREATHWIDNGHEIICEAFYETQILQSRTIVQPISDPPISPHDVFDLANSGISQLKN